MSIKPTTISTKEIVPAGNHIARVYQIIHLGVIAGEYQGIPNEQDKVRIRFELPTETKVFKEGEEPKPFSIDTKMTLSMGSKSNLRPFVEGVIGAKLTDNEAYAFDIVDLMDRTCLLNVVHYTGKDGSQKAKIAGAAPLPKGMTAPEAINPPFILDFNDNWSEEKFASLPQFIREEIQSSNNYKRKFQEDEPFGATDSKVELTPVSEMNWDPEINPEDIPF